MNMRRIIKFFFLSAICYIIMFISVFIYPITALAWGDNSENGRGRPSYTTEEIDNGAIGPTQQSDGENYKDNDNYPGQIIFNSTSDNKSIGGSEKNFVAARECFQREDGSWEGVTEDTVWSNDDITVEDGNYYIIRLYIRMNNPNGWDAVARDTHVSFSIPSTSASQIQVNGFIDSSNATPSEYWDGINFNSETPFHLEYVYGSALLENNGIGLGGLPLSDDIVKAKSGGVLIGYDELDGRIPGYNIPDYYKYDNYVSIKVKVVFDYEFTVEQKVRLAGGDKEDWADTVDAKIGDQVEFRILYTNTSDKSQTGVAIKDILPSNLKYVAGSSVIKNFNHPNGAKIVQDSLVDNGIRIGNYSKDANAYIYFMAEIVDENLDQGSNTLVNWAQAGVGDVTIQDSVEIRVQNDTKYLGAIVVYIAVIITCFIIFIIMICKIIKHRKIIRRK